jgi:hypothetical protein
MDQCRIIGREAVLEAKDWENVPVFEGPKTIAKSDFT